MCGKFEHVWWVAGVCLAASTLAASAASVRITSGPDGRATSISNLIPRDECFPAKVRGRVVKRDFDNRGLYLSSVVIEEAGGTRTFINVDSAYAGRDAATVGRIKSSLETLLAVGRKVDLGVYGCGAAGRVMTIHAIKPL